MVQFYRSKSAWNNRDTDILGLSDDLCEFPDDTKDNRRMAHRASSLSDISNIISRDEIITHQLNDTLVVISKQSLKDLKHKVDESETQKHLITALKERLKNVNNEKETLEKKSLADKEIILNNEKKISTLKEELLNANNIVIELKDLLEVYKQRISKLEENHDFEIWTGKEAVNTRDDDLCSNPRSEVVTLQDELMAGLFSSSQSLEIYSKDNDSISFNKHVLFNDTPEKLGDTQKSISFSNNSEWLIPIEIRRLIPFICRMQLFQQFVIHEEDQVLNNGISTYENHKSCEEKIFDNTNIEDMNIIKNNKLKLYSNNNNTGFLGPIAAKIRLIFNPLKFCIQDILNKIRSNQEDFSYSQSLRILLECINKQILVISSYSLPPKFQGSLSARTISKGTLLDHNEISITPRSAKLALKSDKKDIGLKIGNIEYKEYGYMKDIQISFLMLKLWIEEEIMCEGEISTIELSKADNIFELFNTITSELNIQNLGLDRSIDSYPVLQYGTLQFFFILYKEWKRLMEREQSLLGELQQMVRIYHRIKTLITTTDHSINMEEERQSLIFAQENSYVNEIEKELTRLGLGVISGRELLTSKSTNNKIESSITDTDISKNLVNVNINNNDQFLRREQVNQLIERLQKFPDPYTADKDDLISIRETIRPLSSYGRRAPEPYIGFFALLTFRLDIDIQNHDREIRAFQKVIKNMEDQCDRQQEELEELHEELEQLYDTIEKFSSENSDRDWITLCKQVNLGLSNQLDS
ncbi:hypothetical protein cand_034730 [Cryptosporidium andersoni]|uniref:Uncharacterized protein n=1 Tax=Cryptosporidium andersoni TaxID=117008 RepID=A0A1J4MVL9_9CRYT|nr:hypothetical protein cand_034730 [Cryptosporidium andersoni]